MQKLSFALSILVLPLAFHSVWAFQAQAGDTKAGTATVSGRVTLKGEPAHGVAVFLQPEEEWRSGVGKPESRVKTDENGRFRFTGLKAGRYRLAAIAPGFITSIENPSGARDKAIDLADGENVENQEIALKRGAVITGRVTNANGKPLVEQQVEVTRVDDRGQPARGAQGFGQCMGNTDDRGVYRCYGLPAGRYLVSAGFAPRVGSMMLTTNRTYYQRTFHPDTTEESKAKVIEVSEGFEATGADIKVAGPKKTYDVFGRVEDADTGQPVAGARMSFGSFIDGSNRIGSWGSFGDRTDAQGEFQIQGVLPGKYAVFANNEPESDFYSEPAWFEISDEDVTGLVVKVRRGGSISGVAVIEGTNDPAILSEFSRIELYASVMSDELSAPSNSLAKLGPGGGFTIRGLRPGVANFNLSYRQEAPKFSILRVERDGAPQPEGVHINAGEQVMGVRVVIGYGTSVLRGQLRSAGGALPEGAILIVRANRAGTEIANGRGGAIDPVSGRFVIEGLTPGEYELKLSVFFRPGYAADNGKLAERLSRQKQSVTVAGDQETQVTFVVDLTSKGDGQ